MATGGSRGTLLPAMVALLLWRQCWCSSVCSPSLAPVTNCTACVQLHSSCGWCSDTNFSADPSLRCGTPADLRRLGCRSVQAPSGDGSWKVLADQSLNDTNQIRPQAVSFGLRLGQSRSLQFHFRQAKNYPFDLYILSDKSASMQQFLQEVASMSGEIRRTLERLTKSWRIGVGYFADKPVFPFALPGNATCGSQLEGLSCAPSFSFIHAMNLSQDTQQLHSVTAVKVVAANIDSDEALLDALLQAIDCRKEVGWRAHSRKVVLLAVDSGFHVAGDGRFGGLVRPYPAGSCRLRRSDSKLGLPDSLEYLDADAFDYPSVGQVAKTLADTRVSVIFAMKSDAKELKEAYQELRRSLSGSAYVVQRDGSTVPQLIERQYRAISENVRVRARQLGRWFEIRPQVRCPNSELFVNASSCSSVKPGDTVEYRVSVTLVACPPAGEAVLQLSATTSDDTLTARIRTLCTCPLCEANATAAHPFCSGLGRLQCGTCDCDAGRGGDRCQCSAEVAAATDGCRRSGATGLCSGRGRCVCNKCVCDDRRYNGEHCQLDKLSCPTASDTNEVCGGSSRGICNGTGHCVCNEGYVDDDCACAVANRQSPSCRSAKPAYAGLDCSGHGRCVCGRCLCDPGWSAGPHCDIRDGSTGGFCDNDSLRRCVSCVYEHRQLPDPNAACNCSAAEEHLLVDAIQASLVQQVDADRLKAMCLMPAGTWCSLLFGYELEHADGLRMLVQIEQSSRCGRQVNVLVLVLSVVGAVLVGGIAALLAWRAYASEADRREYAEFTRRQQQSYSCGAGENPLFNDPNVSVANPLFETPRPLGIQMVRLPSGEDAS